MTLTSVQTSFILCTMIRPIRTSLAGIRWLDTRRHRTTHPITHSVPRRGWTIVRPCCLFFPRHKTGGWQLHSNCNTIQLCVDDRLWTNNDSESLVFIRLRGWQSVHKNHTGVGFLVCLSIGFDLIGMLAHTTMSTGWLDTAWARNIH